MSVKVIFEENLIVKLTMKESFLSIMLLTVMVIALKAQDPNFSQSNSNPIYLNPAFAGASDCNNVRLSQREQWRKISGSGTTNISYDQYLEVLKGGIAGRVTYDNIAQGTLKTFDVGLSYSPQFDLFNNSLIVKPGAEFVYRNKAINDLVLAYGDQITPTQGGVIPTTESVYTESINVFDINLGVLLAHNDLIYGFALHHLTQPDEGLLASPNKLPMKYSFHAAYSKTLDKGWKITPSIVFLEHGVYQSTLPSISVQKGEWKVGVGYRLRDAMIGMLGYEGDRLSVAYSFDYTISRITIVSGGTHEINLRFKFKCKDSDRNTIDLNAF